MSSSVVRLQDRAFLRRMTDLLFLIQAPLKS